ncbi:Protein kinase-like domain [Phytophthora cactorum]|nr:Protein kinase-like domain [Phytophthora cactorum]
MKPPTEGIAAKQFLSSGERAGLHFFRQNHACLSPTQSIYCLKSTSMSTAQLRFCRKISDAMYGQVIECELQQSKANLPPLPLGKRRIVAVKCMSLPRAIDVQNRCGASRVLDDPIQESRVADLLTKNGGHATSLPPTSTSKRTDVSISLENSVQTETSTHTSPLRLGTEQWMNDGLSTRLPASSTPIAHRDLSLENVLMNKGECKISDFGLSVDAKSKCTDRVGKEYYMAPEVVAGEEYDPVKADIWSLGIMWFILLTGSPLIPIASQKEASFLAFQRSGVVAVFKSWGVKASLSTMSLVDRMLKVNPNERISLDEIVES